MDEADKLHLAAASFANERLRLSKEPVRCYSKAEEEYVWLAHYEGFKAGVAYARSQR